MFRISLNYNNGKTDVSEERVVGLSGLPKVLASYGMKYQNIVKSGCTNASISVVECSDETQQEVNKAVLSVLKGVLSDYPEVLALYRSGYDFTYLGVESTIFIYVSSFSERLVTLKNMLKTYYDSSDDITSIKVVVKKPAVEGLHVMKAGIDF